jgi:hypothetical protein
MQSGIGIAQKQRLERLIGPHLGENEVDIGRTWPTFIWHIASWHLFWLNFLEDFSYF